VVFGSRAFLQGQRDEVRAASFFESADPSLRFATHDPVLGNELFSRRGKTDSRLTHNPLLSSDKHDR
jgi:hypothetical protein